MLTPMASLSAASRVCWSCRARIMNGLKPQVLRRRTLLPRMQQVRGMAAVGTGFDDLLEAAQKLRDEVQRKRKFVEGHEPGVEDEEDVQSHYQMLSEDAMEGPMGAKYKKPELPPVPLEDLPEVIRNAIPRFELPRSTHNIMDIIGDPIHYNGSHVTLNGYIARVRKVSNTLAFASYYCPTQDLNFIGGYGHIQVVCEKRLTSESHVNAFNALIKAPQLTPVSIRGIIKHQKGGRVEGKAEIYVESMKVLNSVDPKLIVTNTTVFKDSQRNLQLRGSHDLTRNLRLRSRAANLVRKELSERGFLEVETPLLFKSTSEGAREFLVPTRSKDGAAYALPQSPQQYKQMLMASGISKYFQMARCFRDEDGRIDRQPEFTQLDLEFAFAKGADVMKLVEELMRALWQKISHAAPRLTSRPFTVMTWLECMKFYGTDKPDLNYRDVFIKRLGYRRSSRPSADNKPSGIRTEGFVLRAKPEQSLEQTQTLLAAFKEANKDDRHLKAYIACEATANGVPEHQLTGSDIDELNESLSADIGDLIVLRENHTAYAGGSTPTGVLRNSLIKLAVEQGVLPVRNDAHFLWVTEFPLFTPIEETGAGEGQGGEAGLASTHHPFTAPLEADIQHLPSNPRAVRAEHYDLVYNGIELGGGSRRIHDPELQRYVLNDILKLPKDRMQGFEALIRILGEGCPPHAGLAIGWDRLIAVMAGCQSVRDVIAFPKTGKGKDEMVGSPCRVDAGRWKEYGLKSLKE